MDNTVFVREQARLGGGRMDLWGIYALEERYHARDSTALEYLVSVRPAREVGHPQPY